MSVTSKIYQMYPVQDAGTETYPSLDITEFSTPVGYTYDLDLWGCDAEVDSFDNLTPHEVLELGQRIINLVLRTHPQLLAAAREGLHVTAV